MRGRVICMLLISVFYLSSNSFGYEAVDVTNGGSVEGLVVFSGAVIPKDVVLAPSTDLDYCGKTLPAEKYVISADRRIKNVVVYLEGIKAGKANPREAVEVTNHKCSFVPHVSVGFKGEKIVMKNDDPILHTFDVHVSVNEKELYHAGLHEKGSSVTKTLSKTGLMELTCYIHPWQQAYVYVFDHPYAAVTNERGEFAINDVPAGIYTVEAWHEALGRIKISDVKVESRKTSEIKLEYTSRINLD